MEPETKQTVALLVDNSNSSSQINKQRTKKTKILWIVVAIIIVFGGIGLTVYLMNNSSSNDETEIWWGNRIYSRDRINWGSSPISPLY